MNVPWDSVGLHRAVWCVGSMRSLLLCLPPQTQLGMGGQNAYVTKAAFSGTLRAVFRAVRLI